MTTSTRYPVPPVDPDAAVDPAGTAAASSAQAETPVESPQPSQASESEPQGGRHVRATADRLLSDRAVGSLRSVRALTARTRMRMTATSGWLPVSLAVSTVVGMYLLAEPVELVVDPPVAPLGFVLFGTVAGLLAWILAALVTNREVLPARANSRSYDDLRGRMQEAEARIELLVAGKCLGESAAAVTQLGELFARLEQSPPDPGWSGGMGYVNAWRDLHRVELALVDVVDPAKFDALLRHDALRILDSKLDHKNSLVLAMTVEARKLLDADTPGDARSLIRAIREAVNDFRDKRFEALVRNRMHIDRVSLLLGLAAWALLCLAILAKPDGEPITGVRGAVTGASAFYLVGAAVGLFTQLRSGVSESLEDVFGYGQAQLRQILLLSGLAGVAGVFLTSVAHAVTTDGEGITLLTALEFSPLTAVTAAAFGLAPGSLTDRLNGWAKANLKELENTSGASGGEGSQA